ncbi:hypothetical protein C8Q79DRAFT_111633 [Trametes meyenii]|nr:hypothetical protein C8Q79DRAFT_111633 [Trametes meyenii]
MNWTLPTQSPIDPNLSQDIIRSTTVAPMVFKYDASGSDKVQPRVTLKSRVQAALMPRRHIQSSTAILSSTSESECSTLVDFAIGDALFREDDSKENVAEEYVLDPDNSAWSRCAYTSPKASKKHGRARIQYASGGVTQDELLGPDNSSWMPACPQTPQTQPKLRTWFPSSPRNPYVTSGIEPQMLDPEDRAWM